MNKIIGRAINTMKNVEIASRYRIDSLNELRTETIPSNSNENIELSKILGFCVKTLFE